MNLKWSGPIVSFLLLLAAALPLSALEHPGILHQDDNCSSCHADKIRGKSVHSATAIPNAPTYLGSYRRDRRSSCHPGGEYPGAQGPTVAVPPPAAVGRTRSGRST